MDVYRQYNQTIKQWSSEFSQWRGALYCLAVCLRATPLYAEFVRREVWGDEAAFHLAHNFLRQFLAGDLLDTEDLANYRARVEEFTPSTEDYSDSTYACDAGTIHLYALQTLDDYQSECVYYVARYCYELVDAATWNIVRPEGGIMTADLEHIIETHSIIQQEVRWQALGREQLTAVPESDVAAAEEFLQSWTIEPIIRL